MNGEKKSTGTQKSSRATSQKSPGEKLKNEQSAREAVRKKLRYGKKDNSLTVEERKKLKAKTARGRRMIQAETAVSRRSSRELDKHNEDENVGTEAVSRGLDATGLVAEKAKLEHYGKKLHKRTVKQSKKLEATKKETSKEAAKSIQKSRMKRQAIDAYQKKKAKEGLCGMRIREVMWKRNIPTK